MNERPRVLIEELFPAAEFGIESVRERAAASALPPLYFLHVWWARRPLVASAGAILGSLLPAWTPELAEAFEENPELATADAYRTWFLYLCGIWGDPVEARRLIDAANASGVKLKGNGYGYKQAFKNSSSSENIDLLHQILKYTWGKVPAVSDPTAGGGSIPFEAIRYGLPAHANDLNPIAVSVLKAGVELPARFGKKLVLELEHWGNHLIERLEKRLSEFFELENPTESVISYIWARTVACPRTGKIVPLVSDWWLRRGDKPVAVRLVTSRNGVELEEPEFEIVEGSDIDFDPKKGTINRGKANSPWDSLAIESDYIKAEAQAGRMGEILYAVAIRTGKVRSLRSPSQMDIDALKAAEAKLEELLPQWEKDGVIPQEVVPTGNKTREPLSFGMPRWRDMFSPRQLLVHGYFVEEHRKLIDEIREAIPEKDRADAVLALLSLMQGKALNYNARLSSWSVSVQRTRSVFDSHNFAFKWTYSEFEGATALYPWTLKQIVKAYSGISTLLLGENNTNQIGFDDYSISHNVQITRGTAGDLQEVASGSQTLVCIDPPYFDNVMYAELADFFYVWEKRTLGHIWPELFVDELTNKRDEAVANKARFTDAGKRAKQLADNDYESKMAAIFSESLRILSDDGVLTVMFTHKRADAWDGLGMALLRAGFAIEASWPVKTESENSIHIAKKNSAKSTIFLVCRKRVEREDTESRIYLDDIEAEVRYAARDALSRGVTDGLGGVDLLLSTYGPALSVLSKNWPVYSSEADDDGQARLLRPEEALDIARKEVTHLQKTRLLGKEADFDPVTDFVLIAWDTFKARQFPFDDARRLALAVSGLDMKELEREKLFIAKSGTVTILEPSKRLRRGGDESTSGVNRDRTSFPAIIDAVHTALYLVETDGTPVAKRWLDDRGLTTNQKFLDCLQALINAVPRSKNKGEWNVAEAKILDRLATTHFPQISIPEDPEDPIEVEELTLDL